MRLILFSLLLIILFRANIVFAVDYYDEIKRPDWHEICPEGLQNEQYKEIQWYWPYSVKQTQEELNFWALKRENFNEQIEKCDLLLGDFKGECYSDVKERFIKDFEDHKYMLESKKIFNQGIDDNIYRNPRPIMINITPNT